MADNTRPNDAVQEEQRFQEEQRLLNLALQQSERDLLQKQIDSIHANDLNDIDANEMKAAIQMSIDETNDDDINTDLLRAAIQMSMAAVNNQQNDEKEEKQELQNENKNENKSENSIEDKKDKNEFENKNEDLNNLNINDLYNLLPANPSQMCEEMKTESFTNRLKERQNIKNDITDCQTKLVRLQNSLKTYEDINMKQKSLSAWHVFLGKWRLWDIDGFYHYLSRVENGKYKQYIENKQLFLQNWDKLAVNDNGDRFNSNHTFYGHYISQFESDDLQDLGISSRQSRRHIMNNFRSLISDQFEGLLQKS